MALNSERLLTKVLDMVKLLSEDEKKVYDHNKSHRDYRDRCLPEFSLGASLLELEELLREDVAKKEAKSSGTDKARSTVMKIINANLKGPKPVTGGAWYADGKQYITDDYHAFALTEHLDVPKVDESCARFPNVRVVFDGAKKNACLDLYFPSASELSAHIKEQKAEWTSTHSSSYRRNNKFNCTWDFGEGLPLVNAEYLLDILTVIKNPMVMAGESPNSTVYICGDNGEAVLCPVRRKVKKAEQAA